MPLTISRRGAAYRTDMRERAAFRASHWLKLPALLETGLLSRIQSGAASGTFTEVDHHAVTAASRDLRMTPDSTSGLLVLLFNDPRVLAAVADLADLNAGSADPGADLKIGTAGVATDPADLRVSTTGATTGLAGLTITTTGASADRSGSPDLTVNTTDAMPDRAGLQAGPHGPVTRFNGSIYRMLPGTGHQQEWHDDLTADRLVAISVNVGTAGYEGGTLEMRERETRRIVATVPNTGPGDAVLFRLHVSLEHRVTPVTRGVKTAFAGWFRAGPTLRADLLSAR